MEIEYGGKTLKLNKGQVAAVEGLLEVCKGTREPRPGGKKNIASLIGYAGTGKTTLIRLIVDRFTQYFKEEYTRSKAQAYSGTRTYTTKMPIAVTAPTAKAKDVISGKVGREHPSHTVQALLGLAPNVNLDNFDINKPEFEMLNEPKMRDYMVIVIDEDSMLQAQLVEKLFELAEIEGTVLIFAGDEGQCRPVKEKTVSIVFSSPQIGHYFYLTEPTRQEGDNPILDMCDTIRMNYDSKHNMYKQVDNMVTNEEGEQIGYKFINNLNTFGSMIVSRYAGKKQQENPNYLKVLCYRNTRVEYWNGAVREALIGRLVQKELYKPEDEYIMEGELLMGWRNHINTELVNSAEYKVLAVEPIKPHIIEYGRIMDDEGTKEYDVTVGCISISAIRVGAEGAQVFQCKIVVPTKENYAKFAKPLAWLLNAAKKFSKWAEYNKFKAEYLLLYDIPHNNKLLVGKDIDYAYALTGHKSQGSTYEEVYIDDEDISLMWDNFDRNSLKYVAISRAAKRAYILIK